MSNKRPFYQFSDQADRIWRMLYEKQWSQCEEKACKMWLDGVEPLGIDGRGVPDFAKMDRVLQDLTGWELLSTDVQFSDGQDWFEHLARKEFLITEYIRKEENLDYTPLPDIWHDAFGHLPFMANQWYADYFEQFGKYAIQYTKEQRKSFGSMWWYTVEFGLIEEEGEVKAFGTGLMSSYGEMKHAFSGDVKWVPFSVKAFEEISPSPHEMHDTLFVLESYEQLEEAVLKWLREHDHLEPIAA